MDDIKLVKTLKSVDNLDEDTPNFMLLEELLSFFMVYNLLVEVTIVCELHHYAELTKIYHRFLP